MPTQKSYVSGPADGVQMQWRADLARDKAWSVSNKAFTQ